MADRKEILVMADVNINRAREGVRVIEDTIRLVKKDVFFLSA